MTDRDKQGVRTTDLIESMPGYDDMPVRGISLADCGDMLLLSKERCPACLGEYVLPMRYVVNARTRTKVLLRCCLSCRSSWNPPGLVGSDDEITLSSEGVPGFHLSVQERNTGYAKIFFERLHRVMDFSSVLEIGCGIGTALNVAASMGKKVRGYDINRQSVEKGKDLFSLPLYSEEWKHDTVREKYDLILCISTLEHFVQPLRMVHELAMYARAVGAVLFVSVPLFRQNVWSDALHPFPEASETNIFRLAFTHFTFFSPEALEKAFARYGCTVHPFRHTGTWAGILCDFRDSAKDGEDIAPLMAKNLFPAKESCPESRAEILARLDGRDVYFWGCGELYHVKKRLFASVRPRCILVDSEEPCGRIVDGLPVRHPRDMLKGNTEILPIIVFVRDVNRVYGAVRRHYPQFSDLIFSDHL